jgi:hypothetical protein
LDPEHRLRDFLTRIAQPDEFLEADSPAAEQLLARVVRLETQLTGLHALGGYSPL